MVFLFLGTSAEKWRDAYGAFCSSHNEAVGVHKDLMKSDLQPPWSRDTTLSFSQNRASYSEPTCRVVIE